MTPNSDTIPAPIAKLRSATAHCSRTSLLLLAASSARVRIGTMRTATRAASHFSGHACWQISASVARRRPRNTVSSGDICNRLCCSELRIFVAGGEGLSDQPSAPDPHELINYGHQSTTARQVLLQ